MGDDSDSNTDSSGSSTEDEAERLRELAGEIFGDSDEEDDEFLGFEFELPETINWTDRGQPVCKRDLLIDNERERNGAGPTFNDNVYNLNENSDAYDFSNYIFDDEILSNIIAWSKQNAKKNWRQENHKGRWTNINLEEIKAFLLC